MIYKPKRHNRPILKGTNIKKTRQVLFKGKYKSRNDLSSLKTVSTPNSMKGPLYKKVHPLKKADPSILQTFLRVVSPTGQLYLFSNHSCENAQPPSSMAVTLCKGLAVVSAPFLYYNWGSAAGGVRLTCLVLQ